MERLIPQLNTVASSFTAGAVTADTTDKNGAVLTVAFGILVFWSAAAMIVDYIVGEHRLGLMAGKVLLTVAVCLAIPLIAMLALVPSIAAPFGRFILPGRIAA